MIDALSNSYHNLSEWEWEFLESIDRQLDTGSKLSSKQMDKLVAMYEKKVLGY